MAGKLLATVRIGMVEMLLVDKGVWVGSNCICEKVPLGSLHDEDRRVRVQKKSNVWSICLERGGGTSDRGYDDSRLD
jgi:hypothetical protein